MKISITWSTEDIKSVKKLTTKQANKVLKELKKNHDASIGINWDVIDNTISYMRLKGEI